MDALAKDCVENLGWYLSLNKTQIQSLSNRVGQNLEMLYQVLNACKEAKQNSILDKYMPAYMEFSKKVQI